MDKLDFLDGQPAAEQTTAAETPAVAQPEPAAESAAPAAPEGAARDAQGRFASKTAGTTEAPAEAAPEAAPQPHVEAQKAPDGYVPLPVMLELRDEVKDLKRQLEETRKAQAQTTVQPQPGDDGYEQWAERQAFAQTVSAEARVQIARSYAVKEHGEDLVNAAQQWAAHRFELDPAFRTQALSAENPIAFAIDEYQHHQALQMLRDPKVREQFMALASGQPPPAAATASPPPASPKPAAPPPSITSAPSAGGVQHVPSGPGTAYGAVFR